MKRKKAEIYEGVKFVEDLSGLEGNGVESIGKIDNYKEMIEFVNQMELSIEQEKDDLMKNSDTCKTKWRFQPEPVKRWLKNVNAEEISDALQRARRINKKLKKLERSLTEIKCELNSNIFSPVMKLVPIEKTEKDCATQKTEKGPLDRYLVEMAEPAVLA